MTQEHIDGAFTSAINDYLNWHALRGSSSRHQTDIRPILERFAREAAPGLAPDQVRREHCAAFLKAVRDRGCKPNTIEAYRRVIHAFFAWLIEEEQLAASPMRRIPRPELIQEPIQPFTPDELARLLAQPDRSTFTGLRDAAFIGLLADTGLRISEALGVTMAHIDFRERSITVLGKGGKPRTVFFGEEATGLLRAYLRRRGPNSGEDPLFVSSLGEQLHRFAMSHRLRDYGMAAGIRGKRVSPHTLRHTFAISWLLGGGDSLSLQRLLGHSKPTMTMRYVNFASSDLARLHRTISPLDRMKGTVSKDERAPGQPRRRLR